MNSNELVVKMIFDRWNALLKNCDDTLNAITDEQLQKEIAPGRNRGVYVLGHLIAVHDSMLPLLDLGDKQHEDLHEVFIKSPDKKNDILPSPQTLREIWKEQIESLRTKFESLSTDDWFSRHTAVSAEEFAREPHRNKLNILLTRTTHLAYHWGQLILIK